MPKAPRFNSRSSFQDISSSSSVQATHRSSLRSYPPPVAQTEIRGALTIERPIDELGLLRAGMLNSRRSAASPYERGIRRADMKGEPMHGNSRDLVSDGEDNEGDEDDEDDEDDKDDKDDKDAADAGSDYQPSDSESQGSRSLIAKPVGEVGRPNRGGYTLKVALKWDELEYKKLQVCIQCKRGALRLMAYYSRNTSIH